MTVISTESYTLPWGHIESEAKSLPLQCQALFVWFTRSGGERTGMSGISSLCLKVRETVSSQLRGVILLSELGCDFPAISFDREQRLKCEPLDPFLPVPSL